MNLDFFGYSAPFVAKTGEVLPFQSGIRIIQNDILLSILTLRGRIPHKPNFGTNLRRAVFGNIDNFIIDDIREEITEAVRSDGRVRIDRLSINEREDDRTVISNAESDTLALQIKLELSLIDEPNVTFLVEI